MHRIVNVVSSIALLLTLTACATTPSEPEPASIETEEAGPNFWQLQRADVVAELRRNPHLSVVEHTSGEIMIHVRSGESFRTADNRPGEELLQILQDISDALSERPTLDIVVIGHTDGLGRPESNQRLSEARARAAHDQLVAFGLPESRVFFEGRGADEPIATNDTSEGRAVNRRVDFLIRDVQDDLAQ